MTKRAVSETKPESVDVVIPEAECTRCVHKWKLRKLPPGVCPKCRSPRFVGLVQKNGAKRQST